MSLSIWKFKLEFGKPLVTPGPPRILSVGQQDGVPYLWATIDPAADPYETKLLIVGTGHDAAPVGWRDFIGTIHGVEGNLVLHVFDEEMPF